MKRFCNVGIFAVLLSIFFWCNPMVAKAEQYTWGSCQTIENGEIVEYEGWFAGNSIQPDTLIAGMPELTNEDSLYLYSAPNETCLEWLKNLSGEVAGIYIDQDTAIQLGAEGGELSLGSLSAYKGNVTVYADAKQLMTSECNVTLYGDVHWLYLGGSSTSTRLLSTGDVVINGNVESATWYKTMESEVLEGVYYYGFDGNVTVTGTVGSATVHSILHDEAIGQDTWQVTGQVGACEAGTFHIVDGEFSDTVDVTVITPDVGNYWYLYQCYASGWVKQGYNATTNSYAFSVDCEKADVPEGASVVIFSASEKVVFDYDLGSLQLWVFNDVDPVEVEMNGNLSSLSGQINPRGNCNAVINGNVSSCWINYRYNPSYNITVNGSFKNGINYGEKSLNYWVAQGYFEGEDMSIITNGNWNPDLFMKTSNDTSSVAYLEVSNEKKEAALSDQNLGEEVTLATDSGEVTLVKDAEISISQTDSQEYMELAESAELKAVLEEIEDETIASGAVSAVITPICAVDININTLYKDKATGNPYTSDENYGSEAVTQLAEGKTLQFTIQVPAIYYNSEAEYSVVRRHENANGSVLLELLETTRQGDILTFESDKFSTFLITEIVVEEEENAELSADMLEAKYFFYNQLSDLEKEIYNLCAKITVGNTVGNTSITIPEEIVTKYSLSDYTAEAFDSLAMKTMIAYVYDNPMERAIYTGVANIKQVEGQYIFSVEQRTIVSDNELELAKNRMNQIATAVGMEDDLYTRTRKLWQAFVQSMTYNPYYFHASQKVVEYDDCVLGCLNRNQAVCAGFADAFKLLCDELQIPCIQVGNAGHAWNYVKMDDGKWYALDLSLCNYTHEVELENFLVGALDPQYATAQNYNISELYMGSPDYGFTFPQLADYQYVYTGNSTDFSVVEQEISVEVEEYEYEVNADGTTCTLVKYLGEDKGDLIVPETIEGYTVTKIGEAAYWAYTGFTGKLVIPDTVVEIGACAFMDCNGLTGVLTLPSQLKTIGKAAFAGCVNLTGELYLPDTLTYIDVAAFYNCTGFTGDLVLPDQVEIEAQAFWGCTGFDGTCYISDSVNMNLPIFGICGFTEFAVNDTNENFSVYDGVLYTKDMKTLLMCPYGKSGELKIPDTVTKIAPEACQACSKLTGELKLPEGLESIGGWAFQNTNFTGDLIIPDTVTEIGYAAFATNGNYEGFGELHLSENLETLEAWAFVNNWFEGPIVIPDSLVNLPDPSDINPFHNTNAKLQCNCTNKVFTEYVINNQMIDCLEYVHCSNVGEEECENCVGLQLTKEIRRAEVLLSFEREEENPYETELRAVLESANAMGDSASVIEMLSMITALSEKSDAFNAYYDPTTTGNVISGVVTSYGDDLEGTVKLLDDGSNVIGTVTVTYEQSTDNADKYTASYSFVNVGTGMYTVQFAKENHVTREYGITVAGSDVTQDAEIHLLGDVDGNGKLNVRDKKMIHNHIDGVSELTGYDFMVGDVDGNGKLNVRDKKMIHNHIDGVSLLW